MILALVVPVRARAAPLTGRLQHAAAMRGVSNWRSYFHTNRGRYPTRRRPSLRSSRPNATPPDQVKGLGSSHFHPPRRARVFKVKLAHRRESHESHWADASALPELRFRCTR